MPETIAHYNLLDRIGAGGTGELYRARDTRLGRTVAIEVLPAYLADDPARHARFLHEARTATGLSHPNIAALFEVGEEAGRTFLVYEYVPGETLRNVIGGRPLNTRRAIDIAIQLAGALAEAHSHGIVHRDIKPDSIVVTQKGAAKILDFGLAAWTAGGPTRNVIRTDAAASPGLAPRNVAYISPEQAKGEIVDARTDLFSLGVVLFEMLTGERPFGGTTSSEMRLQIVQATPPATSSLNRNVPQELDAIVQRALAKKPDARYPDAATLAADLRQVLARLDARDDVKAARPVPQTRSSRSRVPWGIVVAAGLVATVTIGVAWLWRDQAHRAWRRAFGAPPAPVVVMMRFEPAGDPSRTYFADGLTGDLVARLGQIPGIQVLGRSTIREYRGRDPGSVAREVGATVALTGSVRQAGDELMVTVGLISEDGSELWSEQYTKPLRDVFGLQNSIAEQVARELRVTLAPSDARARTASRVVDARAYDLYVQGRDAAARRELTKAISLFEQAIEADPALAEAHAGLSRAVHSTAALSAEGELPEAATRIKRAAESAFAADPDLPEAQLAMGLASQTLVDALTRFRRAIEIDPSFADVYHQMGYEIAGFDPERAIAFYRRALALDPRVFEIHADIAVSSAMLGRFREASAEIGIGRRAFVAFPWDGVDAIVEMAQDRLSAGVKLMRKPSFPREPPRMKILVVSALRQAGHETEALEMVTALTEQQPELCEARALLAGFRSERGGRTSAATLTTRIFEDADKPGATEASYACAATAAAAVGDEAEAAKWIRRIAERESALRYWAHGVGGCAPDMWLRYHWYPWNKVADRPLIVDAKRALDDAYTRMRGDAARALDGVLKGIS